MLIAIQHLDSAIEHMNSSMTILSSIVFDLQKGADFLTQYRNSLVKTVEEAGGDGAKAIEGQIRDYVQKGRRDGKEKTEATQ